MILNPDSEYFYLLEFGFWIYLDVNTLKNTFKFWIHLDLNTFKCKYNQKIWLLFHYSVDWFWIGN